MPRDCSITIKGSPERVAAFQAIFGTTTLCVESPKTTVVTIKGRDWPCYYLDVALLDDGQRAALLAHLMESKNLAFPQAEDHLRKYGYWIIAEQTELQTALRLFD